MYYPLKPNELVSHSFTHSLQPCCPSFRQHPLCLCHTSPFAQFPSDPWLRPNFFSYNQSGTAADTFTLDGQISTQHIHLSCFSLPTAFSLLPPAPAASSKLHPTLCQRDTSTGPTHRSVGRIAETIRVLVPSATPKTDPPNPATTMAIHTASRASRRLSSR